MFEVIEQSPDKIVYNLIQIYAGSSCYTMQQYSTSIWGSTFIMNKWNIYNGDVDKREIIGFTCTETPRSEHIWAIAIVLGSNHTGFTNNIWLSPVKLSFKVCSYLYESDHYSIN